MLNLGHFAKMPGHSINSRFFFLNPLTKQLVKVHLKNKVPLLIEILY